MLSEHALELLAGALILFVGSTVQGAVGFGANLIAAPLLLLIDESFVPAPVILAGVVLNVSLTLRERSVPDAEGRGSWYRIRWALVGLVPGTVLGALTVSMLPPDAFTVLFAVLVLTAVGLVASGWEVRPTDRAVFVAGSLSGYTGTTAGIGGPPMALVHAYEEGPAFRQTMSRFFVVNSLVALTMLTAFGQLDGDDLVTALAILPGTVAGVVASGPIRARVDRQGARGPVLAVSAVAAVLALVRAIV